MTKAVELLSHQVAEIQRRVALHRDGPYGPAGIDDGSAWDELAAAFERALEEARVAQEELHQQNATMLNSRQAIEEERRRYRDLFEYAPDGYLFTDMQGVVREFNRAAAAMLGVAPVALAGKPLASLVPEAERPEFRSILNLIGRGEGPRQWEARLLTRHGPPIAAGLAVAVIADGHGTPAGLLWQLRDLSAQRRTEEQLRTIYEKHEERVRHRTDRLEVELRARDEAIARERQARVAAEEAAQRSRELLDGLGAVVYEADVTAGRFTFVSRHAERFLGYPAETWLADPELWPRLLHPDDRETAVALRAKHLAGARDHELEYRVTTAGGHTAWVRDIARIELDSQGRPARLRGILVNMSKRKRVERKLYFRKHDVETRLLDMIHLHELCVRLLSKLDLPAVLEEVVKAATALQGTDMGAVWHYDGAAGVPRPLSQVGLPDGCLDRVGSIPIGTGNCGRAAAERRVVAVEDLETDPDLGPVAALAREAGFRAALYVPLLGRDGQLQGTLAAYFREPHRPRERQVELAKMYAVIAGQVIDNARLHEQAHGRATTGERVPRALSQQLVQSPATIESLIQDGDGRHEGYALGLQVRAPIEQHPRILTRLADDPGLFSHGERDGDVAWREQADPAVHGPADDPPQGNGRVLRALVVEDDAQSARTLARLLRIWGYEVCTAADGPQALAEAQRAAPDVVLLDIGLPGMNGHEVARSLRKSLGASLLILAVTGYSHPEELYSADRSWFDQCLIKPLDLDALRAVLDRWRAGCEAEGARGA